MKRAKAMMPFLTGVAAMAIVVILAGCSAQAGAESTAPDAAAVAAELSKGAPTGGTSAGKGLSQRSSGGSVTIDVAWQNPKAVAGPEFSVVMDTHSVDLDGYDLGRLVVLRNDQGVEVKPTQWDSAPGGHHRTGILLFPPSDGSGKAVVGEGVKRLELVIRDVAGVKERVLKWEVAG